MFHVSKQPQVVDLTNEKVYPNEEWLPVQLQNKASEKIKDLWRKPTDTGLTKNIVSTDQKTNDYMIDEGKKRIAHLKQYREITEEVAD